MRTSHREIRKRILDVKSKITDEEFFSSKAYQAYLTDITEAATKRYRRPLKVTVVADHNDDTLAFTDFNGVCASEDFKAKSESKTALDAYKELEALPDESALDFCIRMGWEYYVYQMLIVDYLILNRDRHGANIEVLRNSRKKTIRLAPLFDHGLSLLCSCLDDAAAVAFDVMADKPCNNFIGSKSTWDNLRIIPKDKMPKLTPLHESDRPVLLEGLDGVISQTLQNKIWEMIWKRWCAYEDFCHSR